MSMPPIQYKVTNPPPELERWVRVNATSILRKFMEDASLEINPQDGKVCFCPGPGIDPPNIQDALGSMTFAGITFTEIIQNYITYVDARDQNIPIQIKEDLKQAYRLIRDAIR